MCCQVSDLASHAIMEYRVAGPGYEAGEGTGYHVNCWVGVREQLKVIRCDVRTSHEQELEPCC